MLSKKTRSTVALLGSSLMLTIGRGATLPFMAIYLAKRFAMSVDEIGVALTSAMTAGVFFSLAFSVFADRFDKKRYMLIAIAIFVAGFVAIPLMHNALLVILFFAIINCAYSVFSTVLKSYFADTLGAAAKARIFSLNYTFLNIGWTVGPPVGTLLMVYGLNMPFWLSAVTSGITFVVITIFVQRVAPAHEQADAPSGPPP
ncbi:MFS transporter, partial [Cronobacter sakazakii]